MSRKSVNHRSANCNYQNCLQGWSARPCACFRCLKISYAVFRSNCPSTAETLVRDDFEERCPGDLLRFRTASASLSLFVPATHGLHYSSRSTPRHSRQHCCRPAPLFLPPFSLSPNPKPSASSVHLWIPLSISVVCLEVAICSRLRLGLISNRFLTSFWQQSFVVCSCLRTNSSRWITFRSSSLVRLAYGRYPPCARRQSPHGGVSCTTL